VTDTTAGSTRVSSNISGTAAFVALNDYPWASAVRTGLDVLVPGKRYQVFLTELGDLGGLYVSRRGLHEFVVRSRRDGARGRFAYRVVALRADLKS
jgi:hypothetical protein